MTKNLGSGLTLQRCPKLRQDGLAFVSPYQAIFAYELPPKMKHGLGQGGSLCLKARKIGETLQCTSASTTANYKYQMKGLCQNNKFPVEIHHISILSCNHICKALFFFKL